MRNVKADYVKFVYCNIENTLFNGANMCNVMFINTVFSNYSYTSLRTSLVNALPTHAEFTQVFMLGESEAPVRLQGFADANSERLSP